MTTKNLINLLRADAVADTVGAAIRAAYAQAQQIHLSQSYDGWADTRIAVIVKPVGDDLQVITRTSEGKYETEPGEVEIISMDCVLTGYAGDDIRMTDEELVEAFGTDEDKEIYADYISTFDGEYSARMASAIYRGSIEVSRPVISRAVEAENEKSGPKVNGIRYKSFDELTEEYIIGARVGLYAMAAAEAEGENA